MVNYLYRCPDRHESTAAAAMGSAPDRIDCACGRPAARAYTAPLISRLSVGQTRAADTAAATADHPNVVGAVPPARAAAPAPADPRHALLPRP
ncbi:hypothetical protein CLV63_114125 [Murinocardiopsis flavida]|uniref:FmdB family regulatory protein n=1 Tax=Murinocardiopsis flavida TaxID=645275 RepID=A0A2P8DEQ5_9ACTN|nr:transcriptional regulator [Murinocardiopsis flavida]PSK95692.1 hypothetical protein CLV63_114125 [Murinocardiopsis flavida]